MAKIVLACSQKPFAAFIETALTEFDVECQVVVDTAGLMAMVGELPPDLILLNSGFPTSADNPALLAELQGSLQIPVISICEPTEIVLTDDGGEQRSDLPDVLNLPFGKNDLLQKIEKLTGLTLAEKGVRMSGVEAATVAPGEDLLSPDLQLEEFDEKDEKMKNVEAETVKTFELIEIVEEGLPLDELPDKVGSGGSLAGPGEHVAETDLVDEAVAGKDVSVVATDVVDLDFDDFGDTLDDLELDLQETPPPEAGTAEVVGENEITASSEAAMPSAMEVENDVVVAEDIMAADLESEFVSQSAETDVKSTKKQPEPVAGDLDALLDDDDFAEVEILEVEDPVLAGLKSAGLTPEIETPEVDSVPVEAKRDESLPEDDLNDFEDLLDGVASVRDESDVDPIVGETAESEPESLTDAGSAAEFVEMLRPEEVSPPELTLRSAPSITADVAVVAADDETEIELPEDYLEDEEIMSGSSSSDMEIETQPEPHSPESSARMASPPPFAEPRVLTEPQSLDFSQQIEGMTQEWSKQLLQTTYASMDKMIKAIGDLAPTIVNQVAREVIPPLAEKVIKAEIARLEEQLKLEEGEGEEDS